MATSSTSEVVTSVPFQTFSTNSNTEYVTFQYQPETTYFEATSNPGSNFSDLAIGQTVTYEIPVQHGEPSESTYVQLQVVEHPQQVQGIL